MILAAGRGSRLGSLGNQTPKALVTVDGQPLIERLLLRLRAAGIQRCVINLHHLGEQICDRLSSGSRFGLQIDYSPEKQLLDVAGGIRHALPLLGDAPFIVANADICCDFDFSILVKLAGSLRTRLGHLILGDNPPFRPAGDFRLEADSIQELDGTTGLTYLGIAMYSPELFAGVADGARCAMRPLWQQAIQACQLSGEAYRGPWLDVGTIERLGAAQQLFTALSGNHQ